MKFHRAAILILTATRTVASFTPRGGRSTAFSGRRAFSQLASTSSTGNPLLDQKDLPRFSLIQASDLSPAVDTLLTDMATNFESLQTKISPSSAKYDDILPEMEKITYPISYAWGVAGHLNGVKNGEELRKAYEGSQGQVVKAFSDLKQSRVIFDAMNEVIKDPSLSQAQRRALESNIRAMTLGGVGLDGAEKERFNDIKQRLAELATTFSNNVLDTTKLFSLTITDPAELEGVPSSAKKMWAAAAEGDEEKGPWKITLDGPSYIAAMQHLGVRKHREAIYRAFVTRASEVRMDKKSKRIFAKIMILVRASKLSHCISCTLTLSPRRFTFTFCRQTRTRTTSLLSRRSSPSNRRPPSYWASPTTLSSLCRARWPTAYKRLTR